MPVINVTIRIILNAWTFFILKKDIESKLESRKSICHNIPGNIGFNKKYNIYSYL